MNWLWRWVKLVIAFGMLIVSTSPMIVQATSIGGRWVYQQLKQSINANVTITATPSWGGPAAPTDFNAEYINNNLITITWTPDPAATSTLIRAKYGSYPTSKTDGYEVYYGAGATVDDNSVSLDETTTNVYYRAWSENGIGWSPDYAEDNAGGPGMTLLAFIILPLALTIAGYWMRRSVFAFAAAGFWLILGAFAYAQAAVMWDLYYSMFFLSFGMAIVSSLEPAIMRPGKKEADPLPSEMDSELEEDDEIYNDLHRYSRKREKRNGK